MYTKGWRALDYFFKTIDKDGCGTLPATDFRNALLQLNVGPALDGPISDQLVRSGMSRISEAVVGLVTTRVSHLSVSLICTCVYHLSGVHIVFFVSVQRPRVCLPDDFCHSTCGDVVVCAYQCATMCTSALPILGF